MNRKRVIFEIWIEDNSNTDPFPWRVQLYNYIGKFISEEKAKKYVQQVQDYRKRQKL